MRVENFGSHKSKNKQHSSKSHNINNRYILTISERDVNVTPFTQIRHLSRRRQEVVLASSLSDLMRHKQIFQSNTSYFGHEMLLFLHISQAIIHATYD